MIVKKSFEYFVLKLLIYDRRRIECINIVYKQMLTLITCTFREAKEHYNQVTNNRHFCWEYNRLGMVKRRVAIELCVCIGACCCSV